MLSTLLLQPIILALVVVFIIDISGVIEELEVALAKWLRVKRVRIPKPFSCSLCSVWWLSIGYYLVIGEFSLFTVGIAAGLALLTPVFYQALLWVRSVGEKVFEMLNKLIGY